MITIPVDNTRKAPLYVQVYEHIKGEILSGALPAFSKLPSKRKLAAHLQISVHTIESAYAQLVAEGYITPEEKKGYYVVNLEDVSIRPAEHQIITTSPYDDEMYDGFDMRTNVVDTESFPYSIWTRLMRESLRDKTLLKPAHPQGDFALREAIAHSLLEYRNINVSPHSIVIGAGTEYLLGLIAEMLPEHIFALENPCYRKTTRILRSRRRLYHSIGLDDEGMRADVLANTSASIALLTPARHFPTGTIMRTNRRMQLLKWAAADEDRYLIENDFDSEYRYKYQPIPTIYGADMGDNVIYMNTFARTLSPSLRIGFMILPQRLLEHYRRTMTFYSCTVSRFEQHTLCSFLKRGYYEKHINRMRKLYKGRRDALLEALAPLREQIEISGENAGLHFLIKAKNGMTESEMVKHASDNGVRVYGLSTYFTEIPPESNTVIVGYGGYSAEQLYKIGILLCRSWMNKERGALNE